jgi:hypothetical protein
VVVGYERALLIALPERAAEIPAVAVIAHAVAVHDDDALTETEHLAGEAVVSALEPVGLVLTSHLPNIEALQECHGVP